MAPSGAGLGPRLVGPPTRYALLLSPACLVAWCGRLEAFRRKFARLQGFGWISAASAESGSQDLPTV